MKDERSPLKAAARFTAADDLAARSGMTKDNFEDRPPSPSTVPRWAVKESNRSQREDQLDQAQGLNWVSTVLTSILIGVGQYIWRTFT